MSNSELALVTLILGTGFSIVGLINYVRSVGKRCNLEKVPFVDFSKLGEEEKQLENLQKIQMKAKNKQMYVCLSGMVAGLKGYKPFRTSFSNKLTTWKLLSQVNFSKCPLDKFSKSSLLQSFFSSFPLLNLEKILKSNSFREGRRSH